MPIIVPSTTSTTVYTAGDIVRNALTILKVLGQDVTLDAGDSETGLNFLNLMLDGWANQPLSLYHITRENFAITSGQGSATAPITWGTGGVWDSDRPIEVLVASVAVATNTDFPVRIIPYDDYEAIRMKTLQTNYAEYLYIDRTYPLANVYLYPVPASATTIHIQSKKALSKFVTLNDEVILPPGYMRALSYNLAVELAPVYNIDPPMNAMQIAEQSLKDLKRTNQTTPTLQTDPALMRPSQSRYNIYRDSY